jgi:adenine-specific DNA-methyltransferase
MDKKTLHKLFSRAFDHAQWLDVLQSVFGAKHGLLAQPKDITANLKGNNSSKATAAFELGSFTTSDDRIIGLYKIELKPDVWLERNKVGLRELLRDVYKYDVDGAIIVFVQDEKWRLSFVSEIKMLNDEGEVIEQATEPKRYTYLLGKSEKVRTPSERLAALSNKALSIQDILNAFSVEALNEEFYKIIQAFFYELVGGKVGKGRKQTDYDKGILQLPGVPKENRQVYQEFAVRLIGRTVFCWFLKMKKSKKGEPLLPESLLASKAVKANSNYYHNILERVFFQTLNTPMDHRVDNLPEAALQIPFLNGGLFEPGTNDYYKPNRLTGLNEHLNTLKIPDDWFQAFFEELEKYNFTIDENSVTDVEVSVDPEMLGRIFENLLAEIDPDSGETARKATGSFYTPREIVDYMATESLVQYLHNKTHIEHEKLRPIFKMLEAKDPELTPAEKDSILDALDKVKILDPACGSGAFPMGVLQKIVQALQKLDPEAEWWKQRQVDRINNAIVKKQLREKLESSGVEYARKIGIIQNSLYGVDIQPVAAEISKLRCFLTLIVDEHIEESKSNRGIEPLPNLEFKFVTADTLISLEEDKSTKQGQVGVLSMDFGQTHQLQDKLIGIRNRYLQAYGEEKDQLKEEFNSIQKEIFREEIAKGGQSSRSLQLANWNPFSHEKSDWFDPKWMFGVERFDLVIGNPPYLRLQGIKATNPEFVPYAKKHFKSAAKGNWDLYVLFMERGYQILQEEGVLAYIQPHKFFQADFGVGIRGFITKEKSLLKIVHFGAEQIFNSATNYTCLFFLERKQRKDFEFIDASGLDAWKRTMLFDEGFLLDQPKGDGKWNFSDPATQRILDKIAQQPQTLGDVTRKIFVGLQTSADKIYVLKIISEGADTYRVLSNFTEKEFKIEKGLVKPFLMGKDVKRYQQPEAQHVVIFPYTISEGKASLIDEEIIAENYPLGWAYLLENKTELGRREKGRFKETWWQFSRPQNMTEFEAVKVMTRDIANGCEFALDSNFNYHTTTVYSFVYKNKVKESPNFWLGVLNSKVMWFFLQATGNVMRGGYFRFKTEYLKPFPIKRISFESKNDVAAHDAIASLVHIVLFLGKDSNQINPHVPNTHIAQLFEEVIDAMVMELYFKEDFAKAGIALIQYAERDFESIEGKPEAEQIEIIHRAYQKLREKDNEIRNNLKLMDIKLADIVMPIKAAK